MRILRALLTFGFALVTAMVVVLALAVHLAATGRSLPVLRAVVATVGRAFEGQRTELISLRLALRPAEGVLSGHASLTVRAEADGRRRLFFLLNDGLQIRGAFRERDDGTRTPLGVLRLGLLSVIQLPEPLAKGEAARIGLAYSGALHSALSGGGAVVERDDVVVTAADLWYPSDVQGGFSADVEVLLPRELTVVHNGRDLSRVEQGTSATVRFATDRPVNGLGLVAGRYRASERDVGGRQYRLLLADGVEIDADRTLEAMAVAEQGLSAHYGPSGFPRATLCVPRRVDRGFNDGSGVIVVPPRYFADGYYGFETLAHELAHNWWGATVAERWLDPGSGGAWIVEGFAQYSAWRAVAERFGETALVRTLARNFFDPDATRAVAEMSTLDNVLDPQTRATIYQKGGYVTYMLAQLLGPERFDAAARAFIDEFRYRGATDADLERVFAASSGQDLQPFFSTWVRSNTALDLALEAGEGSAVVRNLRPAPAPSPLALWRFAPGGEIERAETAVGQTVPLGDAQRLIVDPQAATADMFRSNNQLPRRDAPRVVAASQRGEVMVVEGEPVSWEPATIRIVDPNGRTLHSWVIDRGVLGDPAWTADGTRILAVESARAGRPTLLSLNSADGGRKQLGHDSIAAGDAEGTLVARGGQLIRLAGGEERVLVAHDDGRIVAPLPAPRGGGIAYILLRRADMELRLLDPGQALSRVLFTWPAARVRWQWAPDGARIFAALPGTWDWQLWELPADGSPPRALVENAARLADFAVSPDGHRLAVVAQSEPGAADERAEVFALDVRSNEVRRFDLGGRTALGATWLYANALVLVTADAAPATVPQARELQRLNVDDGTLEPWGR
ncbi:MAG: M1 family aminopeptidase [Candidatus Binatia bacterium]